MYALVGYFILVNFAILFDPFYWHFILLRGQNTPPLCGVIGFLHKLRSYMCSNSRCSCRPIPHRRRTGNFS
jgi:hypothetical protein